MARARRRPHSSLIADLFERPQAFDFFQALRLVERIAAGEAAASRTHPPDPIGRGVDPGRAAARIRAAVPLGFAAAEVTAVARPPGGGPIELTQTVVGITGPSGVLPHAFSELVQVSVRERNPGLREFLDLFNNRLAGLLYDAWAKYRLAIERERAALASGAPVIDTALKTIVGIGMPALAERTETPDATLVHFGGLLARERRSATAVEATISGALGHAVRLEQFCGEWLPIAEADRTRLPDAGAPEGAFCRLGEDAVVGGRTFDLQGSVRLVIGPLRYAAFRSLLPDGSRSRKLADLAALALGPEMSYRIRLDLDPADVPAFGLGADPEAPTASRLGWNTWLGGEAPRREPASVDVRPPSHLR